MTALSIDPPFPVFTGTDGQPLENGFIWIGVAGLDPTLSPVAVYWDAALTQPAAQPVRTLNGYPANVGTPARLYVNANDYSILVRDKKGQLVDSSANATSRYSGAILVFKQSATGAITRTVQSKLSDVLSVKDFGAVGDGTTDDTAAIQAAINSMTNNQSLYFPATPGAFYKTTAALLIPTLAGLVFYGDGRKASRIQLVNGGAAVDLFSRANTSTLEANNINDSVFFGLGLEGSGSTRHGINLLNMSRSLIQNCHFDGFGGAAIYATNSLSVEIYGCRLNGCQNGILNDTGTWTGCNGWSIIGNYIGAMLYRGIDIAFGMTGTPIHGTVIESCQRGGLRLQQDCHAIDIRGCYFEDNKATVTTTADIDLAPSSFCGAVIVEGNYFNGDTAADDYYYPIRMGYAQKCRIANNHLNIGGKFVSIETVNNGDNEFGPVYFLNGAYVASYSFQPTINFAANTLKGFCNSRNSLRHDFTASAQPRYPVNLVPGEDLSTAWTTTLAGASAWSAASNGARTARLLRRSGGTATATKTLTVGARENSDVNGRFVTFAVDIYVDNVASKTLTLSIDDTVNPAESITVSGTSTDSWVTYYITMTKATPTGIRATLAAVDDADFYLCNARWYISADPDLIV